MEVIQVEDQLRGKKIKEIYSTFYTFTALTNDGKIITWGNN